MKMRNKLSLLSFPELREEIALGRRMQMRTKILMAVRYARYIMSAIEEGRYEEAATACVKFGGILRAWEVREKADTLATLKSSASKAPAFVA